MPWGAGQVGDWHVDLAKDIVLLRDDEEHLVQRVAHLSTVRQQLSSHQSNTSLVISMHYIVSYFIIQILNTYICRNLFKFGEILTSILFSILQSSLFLCQFTQKAFHSKHYSTTMKSYFNSIWIIPIHLFSQCITWITYIVDSSFHSGFPSGSLTTVVLYFLDPTPKITENLHFPA